MRRCSLAIVLAWLVAVAPAHAISDPTERLPDAAQEARAAVIGAQLRCLVCQNESIEDSGADLARDLRHIVRTRVAEGETDQQVIDWMVARYGDFVRLRPPFNAKTFVLWASPVLALLVGAIAAFVSLRRAKAMPAGAVPLSSSEQATLRKLLDP